MAYEIPISTGPLDAVINKFNDAAAAVERMNASVSKGERAMRGLDRASGGNGRGPASRVYDIARGAEQRYDIAARRLETARATGNSTLIADAQANLIRQERARARQRELVEGSATHGNAVWDAISSSRIGPGGKLYPLVNRLRAAGFGSQEELQAHFAAQGMGPQAAAAAASAASASRVSNTAGALQNLGVSAATAGRIAPNVAGSASAVAALASAALPLIGPVGVAAVATTAAYAAASTAAATQRTAGGIYYSTGSSSYDVARIRGLAGFAGKDPSGAVDALAGALHNGSYGAAVANSRGIVDMGSFTKDRGKNYIRAIKMLRELPERQAIPVARDLGMTNELRLRDLSDDGMRRLENANRPRSKAERRAAADFDAKGQEFGAAWNDTVTNLGNIFLPAMTGFVEFFNPKNWADMWEDKPLGNPKNWDMRTAADARSGKGAVKDDNTAAVEELTRTLKSGREQIGGGSRSVGAVPAGWKLMTMDTALKSDAMAMGAFGV